MMSLEYYLICRKSYDKLLQNLEDIINVYNEIDFGNIELSNNKQNLTFNLFRSYSLASSVCLRNSTVSFNIIH